MKNIARKSLILLLALCMLATLFVGCDTNKPVEPKPSDTKPTESEANPLAERIDMVCWLMGDEPADMKKVQDKINEILLEKINATISFNFTTWTEYKKKYSLLLSSGETIDLIYGADWMDYRKYALDDAFLPLDELLDTYMPNTKALGEARSFWDTMVVEDAIYAIPLFQSEYTLDVLAYRKDLADKYSLILWKTWKLIYKALRKTNPTRFCLILLSAIMILAVSLVMNSMDSTMKLKSADLRWSLAMTIPTESLWTTLIPNNL